MGTNKKVFYFGIVLILAGIAGCILTKDISNLWLCGSGATFIALATLQDKLTLDWQIKFSQIEGKFTGTTDAVRACYADINVIKEDITLLKPDSIDEVKMRLENLEAASGLRQIARREIAAYRPPQVKKVSDQ